MSYRKTILHERCYLYGKQDALPTRDKMECGQHETSWSLSCLHKLIWLELTEIKTEVNG